MKKKLALISGIAVAVFFLLRCANPSATSDAGKKSNSGILPVPFPGKDVTSIDFPTDSNTINGWLNSMDTNSIYAHGWGIWAGLTAISGVKLDSSDLYVYETWPSPDDLAEIMEHGGTALTSTTLTRNKRTKLRRPRQFEHAAKFARLAALRNPNMRARLNVEACPTATWGTGTYPTAVTVNYNAPAANHILKYKLFEMSKLTEMARSGQTDIPDFPDSSIAIKPTYELVPKDSIKDGFFALRVWTGPNSCPNGYPNTQWPGVVYIDITNNSHGDGSIDMNNSGRTAKNSYNLGSFIHYIIKPGDVANLDSGNQTHNNVNDTLAYVGNIAILVGMHVTTKEIKRWTWQSYWWAPTNQPALFPSRPSIAAVPHPKVKEPAAGYQMAIGYTYIWPNQNYSGGNDTGMPIYSFNPYLESQFGINVFNNTGVVVTKHGVVNNIVGCESNCMSCHAMAIFSPDSTTTTQPGNYIADTYIDLGKNNPYFKKVLKLDFLWSIQAELIQK